MNKKKSYYRRITESLPQGKYFLDLSILFLFVAFVFLSLLGAFSYIVMVQAKEARREALESFYYWKQVAEKHKDSPDALYKAGLYAAKIGDIKAADVYISEALRLDPEFEKARMLSREIKK